ncbi:TIGR01777 family oxidoreductase [Siphonobacter curvatus]|uniref:TIGR01777 family protein n=1 Tax=Siphonobacter curvatus TaxID=2094562 RepID=A0A2S7IT66_9BACT|nr:TIGR01777 family oxidoreductase [Siphonobacter curvatus]PQA60895.1 TIGR01777 family protein [Siphonobacter curvatus]
MKQVLLTGGTGLIGTRLTELLLERGYAVAYLTRGSKSEASIDPKVKQYRWDVSKNELDEKALAESQYLIHLAGAGIAEGRWTDERKQEIIDSRTKTIGLIARKLRETGHRFESFVSASGISYYGADTGAEWLSEQYTPGIDYLADVVVQWEAAADELAALGIRTSKLRTGIVLDTKGGALKSFLIPVKLGIGSPLGSGKQYISWIHTDDLCRMYIEALENPSWTGAYNAVAPHPVTNEELVRTTAEVLHKPYWAPKVPDWVLKPLFGEMAVVVLGGNYVLNQRIRLETDFQYLYPELKPALVSILSKS